MTVCRVRLGRDFPATGRFDWALLDEGGAVLDSASSELAPPPRGRRCEAVLAADLVLLERLCVPAAQQRRLHKALRFLAEDSVVPDPARVHVAAAPARHKDVLHVAIVDRDWLAQALGRLDRLGLAPVAAYPESLLPPLEPGAWVVVCNGAESFARTGEREGFALDSAADAAPPVGLQLSMEAAREAGRLPERIVLRAAAGATLPETAGWSEALGVPVERGAQWSWTQSAQQAGLDLLQGEFAPRGSGGSWRARLWRPALLAAATVVVASCGLASDWALKSAERDRLHAEMRTLYRETFGASAVIVDAPLQMRRAHAELRTLAGEGGGGEFITLLDALAVHLPEAATHRPETLSYEAGRLTLSLRARDPQQSAALAAPLAARLRAKTPTQGVEVRIEEAEGGMLRLIALTREAG
jgi:general secretion pathway protein L